MASYPLETINSPINLFDKKRSILIYSQGAFSLNARKKMPFRAKTADGILRYAQYNIVGVIDSECEQKNVSQVLNIKKFVPIFKNIQKAKKKTKANTLIIGIAPEGGKLPFNFLKDLSWALENEIDLINGMHTPVYSFHELKEKMEKYKRKVWETRVPPKNLPIASCRVYQEIKKPIILTVGSDSAIGKLTATYQLLQLAKKEGLKTQMIPTGQTAIMIEGWGITIDKCEGDFMSGAVEKMILEKEKENNPDIYFVEGQGSLFHPAYSTTSLALIHGACPTHLILVYRPLRKRIAGCRLIPVPEINEIITQYEKAVLPPFRNAKVKAIALNTEGTEEKEAKKIIEKIEEKTGLPTADLIRWPSFSSPDKKNWVDLFTKQK